MPYNYKVVNCRYTLVNGLLVSSSSSAVLVLSTSSSCCTCTLNFIFMLYAIWELSMKCRSPGLVWAIGAVDAQRLLYLRFQGALIHLRNPFRLNTLKENHAWSISNSSLLNCSIRSNPTLITVLVRGHASEYMHASRLERKGVRLYFEF